MPFKKPPIPAPREYISKNQTDVPPPFDSEIPEDELPKAFIPGSRKHVASLGNPDSEASPNYGACNYNVFNFQHDERLPPSHSKCAQYASILRGKTSKDESIAATFPPPQPEPMEYAQIEIVSAGDVYEEEQYYYNLRDIATQKTTPEQLNSEEGKTTVRRNDKKERITKCSQDGKAQFYEGYYGNLQQEGNNQELSAAEQKEQKRKEEHQFKVEMEDKTKNGIEEELHEQCYYNIQHPYRPSKQSKLKERIKEQELVKVEQNSSKSKQQLVITKGVANTEEAEHVCGGSENIYEPLKYFEENISRSSYEELFKPLDDLKIAEPTPPIPPRRKEDVKFKTGFFDIDLVLTFKNFIEAENVYIDRLQNALKTAEELKKKGFSEENVLNYFALLDDVYTFHKQTLLKDMELSTENPTNVVVCFLKHAANFHVYIERQRLIPNQSDLSNFGKVLIKERNFEPYVSITKERISDYIRTLQCLRYNCNGNSKKSIEEALKMFVNIYYQLEIIQRLKQVEDIYNKFKECGEVYLDRTFNVSINSTDRRNYLVYLCENLIIFTILNKDNTYQYELDIPTSRCYCIVMNLPTVFEIGIKSKKRFTMKAESQAIKRRWCQQLKKVLAPDLFEQT